MKKSELRICMKEKRQSLSESEALEKSRRICECAETLQFYKKAESIAVYMPIKNEVSLDLIAKKAFEDGKRVCVPVTEGDTIYLSEIFKDDKFIKGKFGIKEPETKRKTDRVDLIFVPGLAFSKKGERLGWGGGYYDRLLDELSSFKAGVAYGFQLRDDIEAFEHDKKMDCVITESRLIVCG